MGKLKFNGDFVEEVKAKHTPGPWKFHEETYEDEENKMAYLLSEVRGPDDRAIVSCELGISKPDAMLIAAAPDMLEALEGAETFLEIYLEDCKESDARIAERDGHNEDRTSRHTQNVEKDLNAVRRAIAKAKGNDSRRA